MRGLLAILAASLFCLPVAARPSETGMAGMLPVPACAPGWVLDGKVSLYDRDTLSDRINGEAELYFPYGFDTLAYVRYVDAKNPREGFDADIYRMGSLLDAFGIYANYRRRDDAGIKTGAEGTVSPSQLFFYQDRYFVRLQATGSRDPGRDVLLACASAISSKIPANPGKPRELDAFALPGLETGSERYIAQSLLGYEFFRRGLMAELKIKGEPEQLFVVPEDSKDAAVVSFERYRSYLNSSGKNVRTVAVSGGISLEALDPLYDSVYVEQAGRFIIGSVRIKNSDSAKELVRLVRGRLSGR